MLIAVKKKKWQKRGNEPSFRWTKSTDGGGGGLERDAGGSAGGWVLIASKNKGKK